jgi:cyclopropane-fatty-acyl-phospholipid synthase
MFEVMLRNLVRKGECAVRLPNGRLVGIGVPRPEDAPLIIHIRDRATLQRILRDPALALGEAYMDGGLTIERGDIYDMLALATRNLPHVKRGHAPRRGANDPRRAQRNAAHHYDISGSLYRLFLDAEMQYSCAYYPRPDLSLEDAQAAKKRHIAAKLLLSPGQRVLDIGSGWGGLAMSLAQEHGVEVMGVTLSREQLNEAQARAGKAGLDNRVRFALRDYREVEGAFDRIVSVGMFEHVGPDDYQAFFDVIARRLDERGVALIHTIGSMWGPQINNPWIDKYIFPGGRIPALSQIAPAIENAGLILTDLEILRLHYADTLRQWRERFAANKPRVRALFDERFCRMWEFYLAGSEAGFRVGSLVVFQLQIAKDRGVVPLTRDYITDFDRASPAMAVAAE